jgi:hypothetical protein
MKASRNRLADAVECALRDAPAQRSRMLLWRDRYYSHLGRSAETIVDVVESALAGSPPPVPPLPGRETREFPAADAGSEGETGLVIRQFGPAPIRAGVPFNVQPSGGSALWFRARRVTYPTVVVFGGRELRTSISPDGQTVSAILPDELFRHPGEHQVYLLDKMRRLKSAAVTLRVEK